MSLQQGSTAGSGGAPSVAGYHMQGRRSDDGGKTGCGVSAVCPHQF